MVSSKLFPFRQVNLFVFCFKIIKNMDLKYVRLIYIYVYIPCFSYTFDEKTE